MYSTFRLELSVFQLSERLELYLLFFLKNQLGQEKGFEALLAARDRLEEEGIQLLIFPVPFKEEVYKSIISGETDYDVSQIEKMEENRKSLLDFCSENGLTCFDPTPALKTKADAGEQLYFNQDTHLNPLGNKILLDTVMEQLDETGWLR